ncbi:AAA family ATPase [Arcobacter roscoffensis]|uniref:DNA repair protein RecN n=1 Tax=Arcobacter roscoffensis TaxID=2961520 RepID=A0ABY5E2Q4_9BACT|nr:AAA family ATPase [Arcobacter roscoffensis]UTJ06021.1 DNA recombination protein RecN [Arcobacter roscoffensis]
MIDRVYLENCLSFEKVELNFQNGLNVFTGPSGAGKSILMEAILSLFSLSDVKSKLGEVTLTNSNIKNEAFDISIEDDIVIKTIKKEKVRFFLNNQTISKKKLNEFSSKLIKHLNLKDTSDFQSTKLINFLDTLAIKKDKDFINKKEKFDSLYKELKEVNLKLEKIYSDESKLEDLKEFAKFEIDKIESINPKIEEYDDLNEIKKKLAKKDKLEDAIKDASLVLNYNSAVNNALELLEVDSSFFDDTMNELTNIFEKFNDSLYELEDIDIENVLDRIEKLASLQKRFGSIKECLEYKEEKIKELESYENISFEKTKLIKKQDELQNSIKVLALDLSDSRKKVSLLLEEKINKYLKDLYLNNAKILFEEKELDKTGVDLIKFELAGVSLETISSGEFNRLRLALLTSMSEFDIVDNGVLFLDEIDANLSGKESEAISKVLTKLAKSYQIFAISHQPQLTSSSNQHFLVDKKDGKSLVKKLDNQGRINEISRMISGEKITEEAVKFAKNLLK